MSIITLTTDYGIKDHFVAAVKGKILSRMPLVQIVDISHCIDFYNIANASYVLYGAYNNFPKGTIHMVLVEAEMFDQTSFLLAKLNGHYILTANNGTITLLASAEDAIEIIDLKIPDFCSDTISLYNHVAERILNKEPFKELGAPIDYNDCELLVELRPKVADDENAIKGSVIYIDHYGNAVTNITKELFERVRKERKFEIAAKRYRINRINAFYGDFNTENKSLREFEGDMLFIFNDLGFLQMAIYKSDLENVGNAKSLFGVSYRDTVIIEFTE
ncbi:SAM-dependent chlorinase/fluorinase [Flavobacterium sp. CBA20B-1]|uniref:SAM hydrolase/SAM-dependent halogenase family protein n=1 Tax=unclassified Flavobacterium TaxID=196869 RepID=UPI00222449C7|nr:MULTISPECIES: SAM-dependent chlorinase/fluorinase [unclassified Flavobacterium]WCM43009.1 SAM-dependent chlorinase/fluorinase [Flavobacterium sp. CBA20B-1]